MSKLIKINDSFYLNVNHVLYFYIEKRDYATEGGEDKKTVYGVKADLDAMALNGKNWESEQRSLSVGSFDTHEEAKSFLEGLVQKSV